MTPAQTSMAFNLSQVLKALLFSTSQPLSVKDIQAAFTRFHDEAAALSAQSGPDAESGESGISPSLPDTAGASPAAEAELAEVPALEDPELYADVPSLVTATQIREAMDSIAAALRAAGDVYLLTETAQGWRLVTQPRFARWVRVLRNEPPPLKLSQSALETLAVVAYRQPVTRAEIEAIRGVAAEAGLNKLLERELIVITGRAEQPGRPLQYGTTQTFLAFVGAKSLDELPASDVLSSRQIDEWLQHAANPTRMGDAEMGLPQETLPLETGAPAVPAAQPVTASGNA
ncbi:MAG: SMC-Scp complex subunit ScpB [Verrucomicrobiota bacterium]